jgi:hypothetical protein
MRVMFPTGEGIRAKSLDPELVRIRGKSWEHKDRMSPHFDISTQEFEAKRPGKSFKLKPSEKNSDDPRMSHISFPMRGGKKA